jgi:hypothetical protein
MVEAIEAPRADLEARGVYPECTRYVDDVVTRPGYRRFGHGIRDRAAPTNVGPPPMMPMGLGLTRSR